MSKTIKIKTFIQGRIAQIDQNSEAEKDTMKKLKLSTQRTAFSNILNVYLNESAQLPISYYKHADNYFSVGCYEQAIFYAQLAKKNTKDPLLNEEATILILKCLIKLNLVDEAHQLLNSIKPTSCQQQYYELKAQIMENLQDQQKTYESIQKLAQIIWTKFSSRSVQMGLFLIEKGRKQSAFSKFSEALSTMNKGMDILIEVKYKDHIQISKIYIKMANLSRKLQDLEGEYRYLICAHSMIRQADNRERQLIETLHKIAFNLLEREDDNAALKELLKIQALQKHLYGQSSIVVAKTVKCLCDLLTKMNHKAEAKRYELEYSRITCCNDRKVQSKQKPLKYSQIKLKNDQID